MSTTGRHVSKLSGYAPALPTPFDAEGCIDAVAFELDDPQLVMPKAHGATAMVVCGTTGEAPTLNPQEHADLIRMAVARSRGRIPVIAGAGANATAHAIALAKNAEVAGADAILSVVPYYNKPTQEGLYCHFRAIVEATSLPVIPPGTVLYARPGSQVASETPGRIGGVPLLRHLGLQDRRAPAKQAAR